MQSIKKSWLNFTQNHPNISQFIIFYLLGFIITIIQLALMPLLKYVFSMTDLINTDFLFFKLGNDVSGNNLFMFDYPKGELSKGGGGGLGYFLAIQITLAFSQIINFFLQRNVTFKSKSNVWYAAMWFLIAYVIITLFAAALQVIYKHSLYNLFMNTWQLGTTGELLADIVTMLINSLISVIIYFPIFKIIFKK